MYFKSTKRQRIPVCRLTLQMPTTVWLGQTKVRNLNSIQSSHLGAGNQITWAFTCCLPEAASAGRELEAQAEPQLEARHSHIECECPKRCLCHYTEHSFLIHRFNIWIWVQIKFSLLNLYSQAVEALRQPTDLSLPASFGQPLPPDPVCSVHVEPVPFTTSQHSAKQLSLSTILNDILWNEDVFIIFC